MKKQIIFFLMLIISGVILVSLSCGFIELSDFLLKKKVKTNFETEKQ